MLLALTKTFAQIQSVDSVRSLIREKNITTMEEFIAALPEDLLQNFTLMHKSNSLHGASFEEPRALLFGKTAQWVVSFNGSATQNAGEMVEMMIYNPVAKTYAFHELDFSGQSPVLHESPAKCLACHGSNPRPIWDHYNNWPGAYGTDDDRYTESEYAYLEAFMKKAPEHPRYKHLKKLNEGYKISFPGYRNGLSERTMVNRNRDLTLLLFQQRMKDIAHEMASHEDYQKVKGLIFYFLTKCYLAEGSNYQGDGPTLPASTLDGFMKNLKKGIFPSHHSAFQPGQLLDYIFSRLGVDTNHWYISSRELSTYKLIRDGSERIHESFINYFLEETPEFEHYYSFTDMDYQIRNVRLGMVKNKALTCGDYAALARDGARALGTPVPEVNTPGMTMRGERVCSGSPRKCETIYRNLPQVCLKCHTQEENGFKLYLPFHELPERVAQGDQDFLKKLYSYITTFRMPMRTSGDGPAFKQYSENDYPKLKTYLETLRVKESSR